VLASAKPPQNLGGFRGHLLPQHFFDLQSASGSTRDVAKSVEVSNPCPKLMTLKAQQILENPEKIKLPPPKKKNKTKARLKLIQEILSQSGGRGGIKKYVWIHNLPEGPGNSN